MPDSFLIVSSRVESVISTPVFLYIWSTSLSPKKPYVKPDVCRSRSRMVISRLAGTSVSSVVPSRRRRLYQHFSVRQFRQVLGDWVIQPQFSRIDQHHDSHARDWF